MRPLVVLMLRNITLCVGARAFALVPGVFVRVGHVTSFSLAQEKRSPAAAVPRNFDLKVRVSPTNENYPESVLHLRYRRHDCGCEPSSPLHPKQAEELGQVFRGQCGR